LVTAKELREQGHQPVCFERSAGPGGVFRHDEASGAVWPTCRLTSSGTLTAFSDYPVSPDRRDHMAVGDYVDYLIEYARAFGVEEALRFGETVDSVVRDPSGGWMVSTSSTAGSNTGHFDAVAVCSGVHQHPYLPDLPGLGEFAGTVLHSSRFRGGEQVSGKRVLIVGAGESGADIVAESARLASQTVLSLRRGVAVVPRYQFGRPRDYLTSRLINSPAAWIFQTRNPEDDEKRKVYRRAFLPVVVLDKCLQVMFHQLWERLPLLRSRSWRQVRANLAAEKLKRQLLMESGGTMQEQFGTKDDTFVYALARGDCKAAPALVRFEAREAVFADGSRFAPDTVIFCTGYETKVPYLDEAIAGVPRYLHTFVPGQGGSLAFIGFVRPGFGAIPPLSELQARWFAQVQSGLLSLPGEDAMRASIAEWSERHRRQFRAVGDRLAHLVDYTAFCDELARQVGCLPSRANLQRESLRFRRRFFSGPFVAAQFRLVGPGAKPDLARRVIEALPIAHPWPQHLSLWLRWRLSRILHRRLGPDYAPKLSVN
ncbi:MAG: SidA/IucD/PvdA family monooxygenase, partial [Lysobacterales bacterium]